MKSTQFEQFIKLMQLSASDSDAEALAALRRATRVMQAAGFTWEMLLRRQVTVIEEVEPAGSSLEDDSRRGLDATSDIDEEDFDLAIRGARGTFLATLESIYEQWQSGARLSPRQEQVVRDAAERAVERRPDGRVR